MEENTKKLIEKFEGDFQTLSSKNAWTPEDLTRMKDLQKLMYYLEVRCAMKEGADYPGEKYMDERSYDGRSYNNSYARSMPNRSPSTGRFTSGHGYPMGYTYAMNNMSGRRYYDSEHDKFVQDLHRMMDMETDPATREAMENVANMLQMR